MTPIGFVKQESMIFKDQQGTENERKWLEAHFRIAGLRPFQAKLSKNKRKEKETHPDFHIYLRGNIAKGEKFRDLNIGALWVKSKMKDDVEVKYMTGNITVAFQKVSLYIAAARPRYEGEKVEYLYDIAVMEDDREQNTPSETPGYETEYIGHDNPPQTPVPDNNVNTWNEDEIPI